MSAGELTLDSWIDSASYFEFESHRIAHWTAGNGKPLLLIHGFPTSAWDWHKIWHALAEHRQVIACDMLGFGLSDKPRSGYTFFRQADIQMALLDKLGVSEFDVVAHDYGDTVAQELLARANEQGAAFGLGRVLLLNGGIGHRTGKLIVLFVMLGE